MDKSPKRSSSEHPPNVFLSLLREAGKPASLHITKFDLPESYGIIDSTYRTERMSHVRRYRLASASRGAKKRAASPVPALAIMDLSQSTPMRTATTSAMPTTREAGQLSSTTLYNAISPLVPSFAPITASSQVVPTLDGVPELPSQAEPPSTAATNEKMHSIQQPFWATLSLEPFSLQRTVVHYDEELDGGAPGHQLSDQLPQSTLSGLLQESYQQRPPLILDAPERMWELRNQQSRVLPLTETNVQLLRPEPSDPRTGESLLRGSHRVDFVNKWFPHVNMDSSVLREFTLISHDASDVGNGSMTTGSHKYAHSNASRRRQQRGPRIQMIRDAPHQQSRGSPPNRSASPTGNNSTTMFHLSEIHGHNASVVDEIAWHDPHSLDHSPRHQLGSRDSSPAAVHSLQAPFAHLHAADVLSPVLQATHFLPWQYPQKSWIRLAMVAESDMLHKEPRPMDEAPHSHHAAEEGVLISARSENGEGGASAAARLKNATAHRDGGAAALSVNSIMADTVTDPSFLFQRMLSVAIPETELVTIRAELLLRQMSSPSSSAASPLSSTAGGPASPVKSTPDARVSSLSGGSKAPNRRFSELVGMVKSTIVEVEDPHFSDFADVVAAAIKMAGAKSKTECRLQVKVGTSPSTLMQFSKGTSATFGSSSPRKHAAHLAPGTVDGATVEAMLLPAELLDKLPPAVAALVKQQPTAAGKGAAPVTSWNTAFQYWMGVLSNPATAPQAIAAHHQIVLLQRAFIERCGMFVESQLLPTIIHEVQITVGGILFSLLPHVDDDLGHHKDLRMDLGVECSKVFTSIEAGDSPQAAGDDEYRMSDDNSNGCEGYLDEIESNQKMASANIRNLGAVYEHWYRPSFPDEVTSGPGSSSSDDGVALLALNHSITSAPDVLRAYHGKMKSAPSSLGKKAFGGKDANNAEDPSVAVGFPLTCVVQYLGFVVSCTARLPSSVENSSQPALRHADFPSGLVSTLAKELGVATYVERGSRGDFCHETRFKRVDGSRHIVCGRCAPAEATPLAPLNYITALPSFMPPLIPTMRYRRHLRLRPEFTAHLIDAVPADLFSSSASLTSFPEKATAQAAAVKIARRLLHKSIADLVGCWEKRCSDEPLHGDAMCAAMQRRGINISLLGYIGDMVHQKVKSLRSLKSNASQAQEASGGGQGGVGSRPMSAASVSTSDDMGGGAEEVFGHKLDALEKTLRTVKEELAVRAFRVHCNAKLRDVCLSVKGNVKLMSLQFRMTQLVKQLLGNESDPLVSTFWSTVITPYVRDTFHFRAPLGRKDLSLRTTLRRLESLCGMVLSPGTAKDALNAVMLHKHEDLLTLELRNTRAIAIGSVLELRPYVKAPPPPFLPPLWALPEAESIGRNGGPVVQYLEEEEKRATQQLGELSNYADNIRTRKLEVLLAQGEQNSEACETIMIQSIVNAQTQVVPLYHRATRYCLMLSRLYLSVHRNLDAARCAEDAVNVALAIPQSQHQTLIASLFAVLFAASKESGSREQVIHALERNIAGSVKRLQHLVRDPYNVALVWKVAPNPSPPGPNQSQGNSSTSPTHLMTLLQPSDVPNRSRSQSPERAGKRTGDASPTPASPTNSGGGDSFLCPLRRHILFEQSLLVNSIQALVEAYKAMSYSTLDAPLPFHESIVTPQFAQFLFEVALLKAPKAISSAANSGDASVLPLNVSFDKNTVDIPAARCLLTRVLHLVEILQLKASSGNDGSDSARSRESQVLARCRDNIDALCDL